MFLANTLNFMDPLVYGKFQWNSFWRVYVADFFFCFLRMAAKIYEGMSIYSRFRMFPKLYTLSFQTYTETLGNMLVCALSSTTTIFST